VRTSRNRRLRRPTKTLQQGNADVLYLWMSRAKVLYVLGGLASLVGFLLPWFKPQEDVASWYSGWAAMTSDGFWTTFIMVGYVILIFAGYALLDRGPLPVALVSALSLAVAMATLVIVLVAAADALDHSSIEQLVWNVGVFVMVLGHALLIFGALGTWALTVIEQVFAE